VELAQEGNLDEDGSFVMMRREEARRPLSPRQ
jgi:hypothetical protein